MTHLSPFRKAAGGLPGCYPPLHPLFHLPADFCTQVGPPQSPHVPSWGGYRTHPPSAILAQDRILAHPPAAPPSSLHPTGHTSANPLGLPLGLAEFCLFSRPCSSFSLGEPTPTNPPRKFRADVVPGFQETERSLFIACAANAAHWVLDLNTHNCSS